MRQSKALQYALENPNEAKRLEYQSTLPKYDFRKELQEFESMPNDIILDAGCGSGVVARHLARQYPQSRVVGCDFSSQRIEEAKQLAAGIGNLEFKCADLTKLNEANESFDAVVCRYVLEHFNQSRRALVASELFRCLKPGAKLYAIDFDGVLYNLYPQTDLIREMMELLSQSNAVNLDLQVGRKIPQILADSGFQNIEWRIETIECKGEILTQEQALWPAKLETSLELFAQIAGSKQKALQFKNEFIEAIHHPHCVLFYNKFTVIGSKPRERERERERELKLLK